MFKYIFFAAMLFCTAANADDVTEDSANDLEVIETCLDQTVDKELCIGNLANRCLANPENSTIEDRTDCYASELTVWESIVAGNYSDLRDKYKLQSTTLVSLKSIQRKWESYAEEKCDFDYLVTGNGVAKNADSISHIKATKCMMKETALHAIWLIGYGDAE